MGVAKLNPRIIHHEVELVRTADLRSQQVFELAKTDDQGCCRGKTTDDGFREKTHQKAQAQKAEGDLNDSHEEGQKNGHPDVFVYAAEF